MSIYPRPYFGLSSANVGRDVILNSPPASLRSEKHLLNVSSMMADAASRTQGLLDVVTHVIQRILNPRCVS